MPSHNGQVGADWVRHGQDVFKASRLKAAKCGVIKVEEDLKAQQHSYDTFAENYDEFLVVHDGYRGPVILAEEVVCLIPHFKDAKIMDIGAGTGMSGERINEKGYLNIDAFDPSKKSLFISQDKGCYKNYFISKGCPKASEMGMILDNTYDLIVSAGTFWVSTSHPGVQMFEEMTRVIKPGGHILIVTNMEYIQGEWQNWYTLKELEKRGYLKALPTKVVPNYRMNAKVSDVTQGKPPSGASMVYEVLRK